MANKSGNAYALTVLCPIRGGVPPSSSAGSGQTYTALLQNQLQKLHMNEQSPMAKVPNTYLCRFWVLSDVLYQGKPAFLERGVNSGAIGLGEVHDEAIVGGHRIDADMDPLGGRHGAQVIAAAPGPRVMAHR